MTITFNDRMYRKIMKSVKARQEMVKHATSEDERIEHENAIRRMLAEAKILTSRI